VTDVSPLQIVLASGAVVAIAAYLGLILAPAWSSYGRLWEKMAASFLTLYILVTLLAVGAVIGLAVVWSYDRFA
jgi:hypothetical protein